jgi:hypothetical protein
MEEAEKNLNIAKEEFSILEILSRVRYRYNEVVQSKNERKRAECLLASTEVGDVLPALPRRAHAEHDAL